MYYTSSYVAVEGVDTPFTNTENSEHACSSSESVVCQENVRCCESLADKCQNLLADASRMCHFGKQLAGLAIYLLLHVRDMKYKLSAKPKVEAALASKIDRLNFGFLF